MIIIYAKDHTQKEVQKLLGPGVKVRNPQFFKKDSDTNAKKVHLFGDYPAIEKAFDCEVVKHKVGKQKKKAQAALNEEKPVPKPAEDEAPKPVGDKKPEPEKKPAPEADNDFDSLPEGTEFPYGYGGGMFFLSDGTKVRGEEVAKKAQAALEA